MAGAGTPPSTPTTSSPPGTPGTRRSRPAASTASSAGCGAADGSYRWYLIKGVPLRDAGGAIVKWFGTCTDIDELKREQERLEIFNEELDRRVLERTAQLEASNKELEAFAYSVSHDCGRRCVPSTAFRRYSSRNACRTSPRDRNTICEGSVRTRGRWGGLSTTCCASPAPTGQSLQPAKNRSGWSCPAMPRRIAI